MQHHHFDVLTHSINFHEEFLRPMFIISITNIFEFRLHLSPQGIMQHDHFDVLTHSINFYQRIATSDLYHKCNEYFRISKSPFSAGNHAT